MTAVDPRRALSFGAFAEEYQRWRPGYPPDAVDWLVPPGATRVADVGAGTGKLTGSLLQRGLVVDAVEPWEFELVGIDPDHHGGSELSAPGLPSAPEETAYFPWTWEVTPDQWCAYLATNSAVAAMEPAERKQHLDRAHAVVARVCETTKRPTAPVRHQAFCVRWRPS